MLARVQLPVHYVWWNQTLPLSFAVTKSSGVVKLLVNMVNHCSFAFLIPLSSFGEFFILFWSAFWFFHSIFIAKYVHSCTCVSARVLSLSFLYVPWFCPKFEEGHLIAQTHPPFQLTSSRSFFLSCFFTNVSFSLLRILVCIP